MNSADTKHEAAAKAYAIWLAGLAPTGPARYSPDALATNLRRLRLAEGLTLAVVARGLGLSSSFILKMERGEKMPSAARLCAIAEFFDVTANDLLLEQE